MENDVESKVPLQYFSMKRRNQSNRKERRRNEEMNLAYARLQRCVPHIPHDQKLAKIKTLRLAMLYIKHLEAVMNGSLHVRSSSSQELRPLEVEDFASIAMAEIQARNNYKDLAEKELRRGIRTEDICRQTIPERYSSKETLSVVRSYSSSPPLTYHQNGPSNSTISNTVQLEERKVTNGYTLQQSLSQNYHLSIEVHNRSGTSSPLLIQNAKTRNSYHSIHDNSYYFSSLN